MMDRQSPRPPATPEDLFARLAELGIAVRTVTHPPLFTVEDGKALRGEMPGGHCKSLFLKDRKGALWLVVCLAGRRLDLKRLAAAVGAARLSFGRPELLFATLGVRPGAVTPFALINDPPGINDPPRDDSPNDDLPGGNGGPRVRVVLDREMLAAHRLLNYHPLTNEATTAIRPEDLKAFIAACGHRPLIVDMAGIDLAAAGAPGEPCQPRAQDSS